MKNCAKIRRLPNTNYISCVNDDDDNDNDNDFDGNKDDDESRLTNNILDDLDQDSLGLKRKPMAKKASLDDVMDRIEETLRQDKKFADWIMEEQSAASMSARPSLRNIDADNYGDQEKLQQSMLVELKKRQFLNEIRKEIDSEFPTKRGLVGFERLRGTLDGGELLRQQLAGQGQDQSRRLNLLFGGGRSENEERRFGDLSKRRPHEFKYDRVGQIKTPAAISVRKYSLKGALYKGKTQRSHRSDLNGSLLASSNSSELAMSASQQQPSIMAVAASAGTNSTSIGEDLSSSRDELGCNKRLYTYRATKSDEFGNKCSGLVTATICHGSCDTGQFSDHVFPYRKTVHKVCTHGVRIKKKAILDDCIGAFSSNPNNNDFMFVASLREYEYVDAGTCVCRSCTSVDTTCLDGMSKPKLPVNFL